MLMNTKTSQESSTKKNNLTQKKMKIRINFVSNSSSCSFIVNDVAEFKSKLVELCKNDASSEYIDLWWLRNLIIRFSFDNTEENREKLKLISSYIYCDSSSASHGFGEIRFDELVELDDSILPLMKNVEVVHDIGADDNDDVIAMLFIAMKQCGIDVDNSCSEKEFTMFESIPKKIAQIACAQMLGSSGT